MVKTSGSSPIYIASQPTSQWQRRYLSYGSDSRIDVYLLSHLDIISETCSYNLWTIWKLRKTLVHRNIDSILYIYVYMQICWKVHGKKTYRKTKLPKWLWIPWLKKKSKSMHFKGADLQQPGSYIQNFKPVPTVKKRPEKKICLEIPLRVNSLCPFWDGKVTLPQVNFWG